MKTFIIGGFLGTGKTSLILRLVEDLSDEIKIAIIENEVGEIGLDGEVIEERGIEVSEITSGCVCCQLAGNLRDAFKYLKEKIKPDLVLIEPTGIAFPSQIDETIKDFSSIAPIISLVDAPRVKELIKDIKPAKRQLKESDIILLNKIDLFDDKEIEQKLNQLKKEFPKKEIFKSSCNSQKTQGIEKIKRKIKKNL